MHRSGRWLGIPQQPRPAAAPTPAPAAGAAGGLGEEAELVARPDDPVGPGPGLTGFGGDDHLDGVAFGEGLLDCAAPAAVFEFAGGSLVGGHCGVLSVWSVETTLHT